MTELDPLKMTVELLGGLALFLYGMEKMTDGLKAAAGKQMNTLLAKLTGNPLLGAITGAIVTAVIQSSSVTTVLVVGFVSAGLMTLVQSVGVIFGANVGTTVTAQIVAFNTTALAYPLIAIGFAMTFVWKQGVARHYGALLMGLGLIFYGMAVMGTAMSPLRTHAGFAQLLQSLQNPVLGMLAGAAFTALVQSSSATIGLAVVMATQGLLSLPAGIAILFGAKIGTGITAVLAAIGKPQDAKRAAAVHASQATNELLHGLFQAIQESAHAALRALVEGDERAAQTVVANRDRILKRTSELHRQQAARLARDDPDRLLKHRVQLEILDKLRRIYSVAEHMAISVLPRSVLVGELSV